MKSKDCCSRVVKISHFAPERLLAALLGRQIVTPVVFEGGMDIVTGSGASWSRSITYIESELDSKILCMQATP